MGLHRQKPFLAKKYIVSVLEQQCYDYIHNNLQSENVIGIIMQARKIYDDKCEDLCKNWIDCHAREFFASEQFKHLDIKMLSQLLERDSLIIEEVNLFKAVGQNFFIAYLFSLGA